VQLLLKAGAEITLDILNTAAWTGNPEVFQMLLEAVGNDIRASENFSLMIGVAIEKGSGAT
jgi:hypothetical protein